jgi:hypothetical protein
LAGVNTTWAAPVVGSAERQLTGENMKANVHRLFRFVMQLPVVALSLAGVVYAGPPLICHSIQIGDAKSLPWVSHSWNLSGTENYDTKNLVSDTLTILNADAPVLVRMETLRRATLYARQNPQVANELLVRLHARASDAERAGHADALAWFDAGYLAEAYKQWLPKETANPAAGVDGYAWVKKALALRGSDPQMEFAAALITLSGPEKEHREHVLQATGGAKQDPLLAQNLASRFMGADSQTIAEMFSRPAKSN